MEQQSDEAFMDDTLEELFAELDSEDDSIATPRHRQAKLESGMIELSEAEEAVQPAVQPSPSGKSPGADETNSPSSLDLIAAADRHLAELLEADHTGDEPRNLRGSARFSQESGHPAFEFPQLARHGQSTHDANQPNSSAYPDRIDECRVEIELGRAFLDVREAARLSQGSIVSLDKLAGDPVDLVVDGRLFARGEVLVTDNQFCIRIAEIVSRNS